MEIPPTHIPTATRSGQEIFSLVMRKAKRTANTVREAPLVAIALPGGMTLDGKKSNVKTGRKLT